MEGWTLRSSVYLSVFVCCLVSGGVLEVNLGIMYVQNAAPDGPVAWMFAEVPDRLLRFGVDAAP